MKKSDIKEAFLDRPYKTQIVISQFINPDFVDEDDEGALGWECDIFYKGEYIGGGTAPTQAGAYDLANDIIYDYENPSFF